VTHGPNILLITSDQQRGDCFGFEGRRVKTPHLDELARGGTRFAACITPNLVCQPSRASILTGLLPLTHGVYDNGVDLDPATGEAGFAGQLGRRGYRTGFLGKAHFATSHTFAPTGTPECRQSYAGVPPAGPQHGRSLRRLIEGAGDGRDFALSEWDLTASRCGVPLRLRTVRTRRHKLTLELDSGAGELYDLGDDPWELDNRFDDPARAAARKELTEMIASRPDDAPREKRAPVGMA
jgi:arylsulfatase A-like enzyme